MDRNNVHDVDVELRRSTGRPVYRASVGQEIRPSVHIYSLCGTCTEWQEYSQKGLNSSLHPHLPLHPRRLRHAHSPNR